MYEGKLQESPLPCPFYSLFLALLAVLLMGIPAVSVQAAGVKTPGKVNITSVKMTGNNKVTINWQKLRMLRSTGFTISSLVPGLGKQ